MSKKKRRPVGTAMNQEQKENVPQPETEEKPAEQPQESPDGALDAEITGVSGEDALKAAEAKAEEYLALAQRVQADFDNYRRRNEGLRAEAMADGTRNTAVAFLEVLDNLERALAAGNTKPEALRTGVELTLKQMTAAYAKLGVTPIDRTGEPFDPSLENAVMQGSPEDGAPGTVCQVLQKGYQMNGTVLRYALVKVVPEE